MARLVFSRSIIVVFWNFGRLERLSELNVWSLIGAERASSYGDGIVVVDGQVARSCTVFLLLFELVDNTRNLDY